MHIALRKGQVHAVLAKQDPDPLEHIGTDIADACFGIIDPKLDLKLDRTVTECRQPDRWCGFGMDPGVFVSSLQHQPFGQFDIAAIGNPNRHL